MATERRPRQEWRVPRGRTWGGPRGDKQGYLRLLVAHMLFQRAEWGSVPVQFFCALNIFITVSSRKYFRLPRRVASGYYTHRILQLQSTFNLIIMEYDILSIIQLI